LMKLCSWCSYTVFVLPSHVCTVRIRMALGYTLVMIAECQ
jgi:hypothetical protein